MTAVAEATTRIGVGPLVACTGFRNPGLLAKMAATLDEVSGARLVLGLGSGVPATDASWRSFGFDDARHVGRHEEAVEVIARLLREPEVTFAGAQVRTGRRADRAARAASGRPACLGGGQGGAHGEDRRALGGRVNVNTPLAGAEDVAGIAATAASACEAVGRTPATLSLTGWARIAVGDEGRAVKRDGWLAGSPDEVAAALRAMRDAGLAHVTLYVGDADDPSPLPALTAERLAWLAPVVDALTPD